MVGVTGPIGSGLPQLGLPRLLAIGIVLNLCDEIETSEWKLTGSQYFVLESIRLILPSGLA
jgi:hypothetical protein